MKLLPVETALTFIEPGPLTLVTTFDAKKPNVMTISWTAAIDFNQHILLATGPWNYSFNALIKTKECVVCIPGPAMLKTAVKIGMLSGQTTDKFQKLHLKTYPAQQVKAPLLGGCIACLECRVTDYIASYGLVILQVLCVWKNERCRDTRLLHAVGDGTFTADGEKFCLRPLMKAKLPLGL